ncbi:MAG: NTP transferase domain-containing protein, partial [Calditrichaeota bacterium]|nr:NTP transferase domain-containing protein [Calditrichota bacterium]
MQAVLMAAGKSTRTYPLTLERPKPLLPLVGKTLLQRNLDEMVGLVDEVVIIVGYRADMIRGEMGEEYRGIKITYCEQVQQLGTGHAVLQAKPYIRGPFLALNGDDLYQRVDLERLAKYDYAALVRKVPDPSLYGVCKTDDEGRIVDLIEKPKTFVGNLANVGCYKLQPEFFEVLENTPLSERGEIEITSAVAAVARTRPFFVVEMKGYWLPTGYAWDLLKHMQFILARGYNVPESTHKNLHGVTVRLPVYVASGAKVEPGAEIGPYTVVETGARIERNAVVRRTVLFKGAVVRENARVYSSVLAAKTVVQTGAL